MLLRDLDARRNKRVNPSVVEELPAKMTASICIVVGEPAAIVTFLPINPKVPVLMFAGSLYDRPAVGAVAYFSVPLRVIFLPLFISVAIV